ncbi:MAG: hypothetical protein IT393_03620, partial [Nitrospirae bacterium]|nr:hypothetical protein [Nitrospirota bacterium]
MPKKSFLILILLFLMPLFTMVAPVGALVVSSDPFDATDRYSILLPASDGSITYAQAKVKAPENIAIGPGEVWALVRYKLPPAEGGKTFYSAVSQPLSIQGLSQSSPALISFDFSADPIPPAAFYRTLMIYYQDEPSNEPLLIAKYAPEQLL